MDTHGQAAREEIDKQSVSSQSESVVCGLEEWERPSGTTRPTTTFFARIFDISMRRPLLPPHMWLWLEQI